MRYVDLEDAIVRRAARHRSVEDGDSEYVLTSPRTNQRDTIDGHVESGRITDSPELRAALSDVEAAEQKIRQAKLANLSSKDKRDFEKSLFSELIKGVETCRVKQLRQLSAAADERRKKYQVEMSAGNATRQLLQLEKSKLRFARTDESEAMVKLSGFEQQGYSESDLLVLGSISERTSAKAQEIRATIPEYLADSEGVKIIAELTRLVEMRPGEIMYFFKGSPVANVVHVGDLVGDTAPTIQDLHVS